MHAIVRDECGLESRRNGIHAGSVRAEGERLIGRSVHDFAHATLRAGDAELWVSDVVRQAAEAGAARLTPRIAWIANAEAEPKGVPGLHKPWRAA